MTLSRLQETRNAYLAECERDRQIKAKELEIENNTKKIVNIYLKTIGNIKNYIDTTSFNTIDSDMEYTAAWSNLLKTKDSLEEVEEAINSYFPPSEKIGYREKVMELRGGLNNLHMKLDQKAKREKLELMI